MEIDYKWIREKRLDLLTNNFIYPDEYYHDSDVIEFDVKTEIKPMPPGSKYSEHVIQEPWVKVKINQPVEVEMLWIDPDKYTWWDLSDSTFEKEKKRAKIILEAPVHKFKIIETRRYEMNAYGGLKEILTEEERQKKDEEREFYYRNRNKICAICGSGINSHKDNCDAKVLNEELVE
jgi:hypothetical protein